MPRCFFLHRSWCHTGLVTIKDLSSSACISESRGILSHLVLLENRWVFGFVTQLLSVLLCFFFFVEIRWVLTTILPLSFPPSHFHVFTRGLRLKGQERTGEALLMVKGERQENKSETTLCLNLCMQDTFVNTLLAQNSHKAKHNIDMQESTLCF